MVGEVKNPMAPAQHRMRQSFLLAECHPFGGERDPVQQPQASKEAWEVQGLAAWLAEEFLQTHATPAQ